MFVRKVTTLLKPNSISKFSRLMEEEVPSAQAKRVPGRTYLLRSERGWCYRTQFVGQGIATYEVVNSTFHKIAAAVAASG